jgi:hypothetical protein
MNKPLEFDQHNASRLEAGIVSSTDFQSIEISDSSANRWFPSGKKPEFSVVCQISSTGLSIFSVEFPFDPARA